MKLVEVGEGGRELDGRVVYLGTRPDRSTW
jgi:hypothetical protein